MTETNPSQHPTRWEVRDLPPEPEPGTVVRDRDGDVWHRRPSESGRASVWWRAGALAPLFGESDAIRRWDQLLLRHGPLTLMVDAVAVPSTSNGAGS